MTIYVARGIISNGNFDPSQIEEGLSIGLAPQVMITPGANNEKVISDFYRYVKANSDIHNFPMKITSHGKGEFDDIQIPKVEESIKAVVKFNERAGKIHVGSLMTHKEGHERFRVALSEGKNYTGLESLYTPEEYLFNVKKLMRNIKTWVRYGEKHDINIITENVYPANYDIRSSPLEALHDYSQYYDLDKRRKDTIWGLGLINLGDAGIGHDMGKITDGFVCIDIGHFDGFVEHAKEYNFETMGKRKPRTKAQKELLNDFGVWVEYGEPMIFRKEIDKKEYFENLKGRIKVSHIGGETCRFYWDVTDDGKKVKKIGSHLPTWLEGDKERMKIIENDSVRNRMSEAIEKNIREYSSLLEKAECNKHVLEIHLRGGVYGGPVWRDYIGNSYKNVRRFIKS